MKELKVWNGRGMLLNKRKFPEYYNKFRSVTLYICAYSRADASKMITEFNDYGWEKNYNHELKDYFSPCWGRDMDGITPERGLWIRGDNTHDPKPPTKIF